VNQNLGIKEGAEMRSRKVLISIVLSFVIALTFLFETSANETNPTLTSEETVKKFYFLFSIPHKHDDESFAKLKADIRIFTTESMDDFVDQTCGADYFIKAQDVIEEWEDKVTVASVDEDSSAGNAKVGL
jgi:hypothetical protein